MSILPEVGTAAGAGALSRFRAGFYRCLTARSDALFELADAVLCSGAPVTSLPMLSLTGVFSRGHGALYDALSQGRADSDRLRCLLAAQQVQRIGGRIVLAVDATGWLRPDANCSPGRLYCHVAGHGRGQDQMVPGWAYSFVAALETGASSWTQVLDAIRIGQDDDAAVLQLRRVITKLIAAGQHRDGDADIVIVTDAGYDVPRLAWQLRDLPVVVVGRLRSDRVLYGRPAARSGSRTGRPAKHGRVFRMTDAATWDKPETTTSTQTDRYGRLDARAWENLHSRLTHRAAWIGHKGDLPVIDGTLIRLKTQRLPHTGEPTPLWLWTSMRGLDTTLWDSLWSAWLRWFDIDHTFRFLKQTLDWTAPPSPRPRRGRHLDMADHHRVHAAAIGPRPRRRPVSALGNPGQTGPTHPRQSPPRLSEPPHSPAPPDQSNVLVVRAEDADDPQVEKLAELLRSDEVRQLIEADLPNNAPMF